MLENNKLLLGLRNHALCTIIINFPKMQLDRTFMWQFFSFFSLRMKFITKWPFQAHDLGVQRRHLSDWAVNLTIIVIYCEVPYNRVINTDYSLYVHVLLFNLVSIWRLILFKLPLELTTLFCLLLMCSVGVLSLKVSDTVQDSHMSRLNSFRLHQNT